MLGCLECTCAFGCNLQDPPLISPQPAKILPQSSEILRRFVPLKYEREKVVLSKSRGFMNCMFSTCKTFGSTVLYSKYHLMYHEACLQWGQPDPPCQNVGLKANHYLEYQEVPTWYASQHVGMSLHQSPANWRSMAPARRWPSICSLNPQQVVSWILLHDCSAWI